MIAELINPAILGFILSRSNAFCDLCIGFPISFTLIFLRICIWVSRIW